MLKVSILAVEAFRTNLADEAFRANRRTVFVGLLVVVLIVVANVLLLAYAQGEGGDPAAAAETAFEGVNASVCAVVDVLRSGFTYAVVLGAIVIGGIMRAAGSRQGMGVIVGALIGGLIVLVAPSIATVFFPAATECAAAA